MSDVSLREYLESQIKWVDRHFASQVLTIQEKTSQAREQIDKRLEGMNEFRDTLRDQAGRLATKDEIDVRSKEFDRRLKELELTKARTEGKAAIIAAIVSVAASVVIVVASRMIQ